jgi:hypothetical protein
MMEQERLMIIQNIKPVPSFLQNPLQGWERNMTWSCHPGRTNPWCQNTKDTTNQKSKLKDHWSYIFVQRSSTCKLDREDLNCNDLALRHPSLLTDLRPRQKGGLDGGAVVDIPNRYTSDVVSYRETRVAHGGGMADSQPGGLVAGGMAD